MKPVVLTEEQEVARELRRTQALAVLEALPPEQQCWQARLESLGACDSAIKYVRKFPDTVAGAIEAWQECKVQEEVNGIKRDVAAQWMSWLCMRVLDQYGIIDADNFRTIMDAESVLAGLIARVKP